MLWGLIRGQEKTWGVFDSRDAIYLQSVHMHIVYEMILRGFQHYTPIPSILSGTSRSLEETLEKLPPLEERQRKDRMDLLERWGGQYRGRIPIADLNEEARTMWTELLSAKVG